MAIYKRNIEKIELDGGMVIRRILPYPLCQGDDIADLFGVTVYQGGEPVSLDGVSCHGYFIRPDEATVAIDGTVSGSTAYVTLPDSCYVKEGHFSLAITLSGGGVTGTMRIVDGMIAKTTTDTIVDPGTVVPSLQELLAQISACEQATDEAQEVVDEFNASAPYMINTFSSIDVTRNMNSSNNGVTRKYEHGRVRLTGTAGASRRLVVWNGVNSSITTSGAFIRILPPGRYKFNIVTSGLVSNVTLSGTYSTFANGFTIPNGSVISLTADTMLGLIIVKDTNYGVEGTSYTDVLVEACEVTAMDSFCRRMNPFIPQYVKRPGSNSYSGFPHLAFPEVFYANGNEYIVSRASQSHYAPDDPADWGGCEIDRLDDFGRLDFVKLMTASDFQDGTMDLQGHLGAFRALPTPDGEKLLINGWTSYGESSHDNYIALLDRTNLNVLEYTVNSVLMPNGANKPILLEGTPLITPEGHILLCGYRGDYAYIARSNEAFGSVTLRELTFTVQLLDFGTTTIDGVTVSVLGNECCLGYANNKLWCLFRNSTKDGNGVVQNGRGSILIGTDDLEGSSGWTIKRQYNTATDGAYTALHEPRLLPYDNEETVLWVSGARYYSSTRRDAQFCYIDLTDPNFKMHPYTVDNNVNYGGYSSIQRLNSEEFEIAYYREGDNGPSSPATAISSAVLYRRLNARKVFPELYYLM